MKKIVGAIVIVVLLGVMSNIDWHKLQEGSLKNQLALQLEDRVQHNN